MIDFTRDNASAWRLVAMDPPSPKQAHEISMFLQGQLRGHRHPEKDRFTRWKLCENEAYPGFASAMVVGPSERIVSVCTVTPKRLWRKQAEQRWGEIGDTFTDTAYLRRGMFVSLVNASRSRAQEAGFQTIYGLPNDQSLPGYISKLDFTVKEDLVLDGRFAFLSTLSLGVRTRLSQTRVVGPLLRNPLVVEGSRRLVRLAFSLASTKRTGVQVSAEGSFGGDFDALWHKTRSTLPNAQVRDARYLAWRYGKNPFPIIVLAARGRDALLGYVALLTVRHRGGAPFTHTILLDWLYDPSWAPAVGEALLSAALRHAVSERADVVSAVVCRTSPLKLPFARLGFVRQHREMPVIIHCNEQGRELLNDPSPWHFTLSDTDAF